MLDARVMDCRTMVLRRLRVHSRLIDCTRTALLGGSTDAQRLRVLSDLVWSDLGFEQVHLTLRPGTSHPQRAGQTIPVTQTSDVAAVGEDLTWRTLEVCFAHDRRLRNLTDLPRALPNSELGRKGVVVMGQRGSVL